MIIAAQPKITLTYSPDKGEFTVNVTETKQVSYTIEYDWHSLDATGAATVNTDALTNTKAADAKNKFSDTQVAGTVSSGDTYIHQVLKGNLTLSADTLDGKVVNYQQVFKVTEDKKLKIISEQSGTKAATDSAVLGITTTASESAMPEPVKPVATAQPRATTLETEPTTTSATSNLPVLPLAVGGITLGVGIILGAIWHHHRKKSTITKLTELPAT